MFSVNEINYVVCRLLGVNWESDIDYGNINYNSIINIDC
uniref:Uncharacterized protein n=1 Tax=viral metagenome TaxID=1070528 RepID=A0A6C0LKT7_9ZZZZ